MPRGARVSLPNIPLHIILVTPKHAVAVGQLMKRLGQEDAYLLGCYRYIELNPVRAEMAGRTADYPWSSYRVNGHGETSELLTPHAVYMALECDEVSYVTAYRELFRHHLDTQLVDEIRTASNGDYVRGSSRFAGEVEKVLGSFNLPLPP